ncbi:hypothetical protein CLW00_1113 [Mongoliibacter ruber]|uniref:Uncharacterized protein n=1 Tax=Mongoliibacter ruber TaxID=1750599 RepID=A0A2T0WG36_9BACT|nr:hypothetical protein CLW00_1113 [Mongoliibacter ruber]
MAMSDDTHGGEIVSTFSDKKTFEVQKRPQRLAVPDLLGFPKPRRSGWRKDDKKSISPRLVSH